MGARDGYLLGLIGAGIGPSLSPPMHEREAAELGLRCHYRRIDLEALGLPPSAIGDILTAARLTGYSGVNVTHPCKQLVVEHLDELSGEAAALGAVNTVTFGDDGFVGHNTDLPGFSTAFTRGLPNAATDRVVLLGAGGAGTAVAHALLRLGTTRLHVFDVDTRRGDGLAADLSGRFGSGRVVAGSLDGPEELATALADADGLVHATPTGMAAHPGMPLPPSLLRGECWIAEVVYRPLETPLVTAARERGCRVLDGGRMAVFQAAESFRLFTGATPDPDRMLRHFQTLIGATDHGRY